MAKWSKERYDTICKHLKNGTDIPMILTDLSITNKQFEAACARMVKTRIDAGKSVEDIHDETGISLAVINKFKPAEAKKFEHIEMIPETLDVNARLDIIFAEIEKLNEKINKLLMVYQL